MESTNYKSLVFWGRSIAPNTNRRFLVSNDGVKPLRLVLFLKYCKRKDVNRQCCHRSFVISKNRKTSIVGACIDLLLILTRTSLPLVLQRWTKSCFLSCHLIRDIEAQKHILNSIFLINPCKKVIVILKTNYKFWLDDFLHKEHIKNPKIICDLRFIVKARDMFEIAKNVDKYPWD